jgi:hypothetical protein
LADPRRFELMARLMTERFAAPRIWDIAGGQGRLNAALTALGREVTTFDNRWKRLPNLRYEERFLTLDEPCGCDLLVGMHPDGATRIAIEYAVLHRIPVAVVPCCSDNSMPYKPWVLHIAELAEQGGMTVDLVDLPMEGRCRVVIATPAEHQERPRSDPHGAL